MARVPKIAPGGTNLLVRVLDVNRALIPDVFIEVVGKRGSINENPNAVNPADGVRFRGEKAWGFEDSEFDGAASMTLTIRAFKAGADFGPIPVGDVPDWTTFAPGVAAIEMELVKRQDDFVDILLYDKATATCLRTLVIPPEQVVTGTPSGLRPTEYSVVSRNLSRARARAILDFLHFTGQITLEAGCAPQLVPGACTFTPGPDGDINVKLRSWVSSVRIITNLMGAKQFTAKDPNTTDGAVAFSMPEFVSNLDTRNAVALVRLIKDLRARFTISEFFHAGIGAAKNAGTLDCHSEGRAVDFVGVRLPGQGGTPSVLIYIQEFWGSQSVPAIADLTKNLNDPTRKARGVNWPETNFPTLEYRNASRTDASMGATLRRAAPFWRGMWNMIIREYLSDAAGAGVQDIGNGGFVMHPDHPTSAPSPAANGRQAHQAHLHFQIGLTGKERATRAPTC